MNQLIYEFADQNSASLPVNGYCSKTSKSINEKYKW